MHELRKHIVGIPQVQHAAIYLVGVFIVLYYECILVCVVDICSLYSPQLHKNAICKEGKRIIGLCPFGKT